MAEDKKSPSRKPDPVPVTAVLAVTRDNNGYWGYREVKSVMIKWLRNEGRPFNLKHIQVPRKEWDAAKAYDGS